MARNKSKTHPKDSRSDGPYGEGPELIDRPDLSGPEGAYFHWTVWEYTNGPWKYGVHLTCTHPDRRADDVAELCRDLKHGKRKCLSVCMRGWRMTKA